MYINSHWNLIKNISIIYDIWEKQYSIGIYWLLKFQANGFSVNYLSIIAIENKLFVTMTKFIRNVYKNNYIRERLERLIWVYTQYV